MSYLSIGYSDKMAPRRRIDYAGLVINPLTNRLLKPTSRTYKSLVGVVDIPNGYFNYNITLENNPHAVQTFLEKAHKDMNPRRTDERYTYNMHIPVTVRNRVT